MFKFDVKDETYKVRFGYGVLRKTNLIDRITGLSDLKEDSEERVQEVFSLLSELLLAGLQKHHKDKFGYETEDEKKNALDKVDNLLDDYEDEGTEDKPQNGYILFEKLQEELMNNGFLSGLVSKEADEAAIEKNATVMPQDRKEKK